MRLIAFVAATVTALGLVAAPGHAVSAHAAPAQAAPARGAAPARTAGPSAPAAPTGTYAACPTAPAGQMRCLSLVRAAGVRPMGVQASSTPGGYAPADLRAAYTLPSETAGSGQTVAIVDAYHNPDAEADLGVYRAQYGLPPCTTANGCFTQIDQRGGHQWAAVDPGWAGEISLDLDMVSAVCPACNLLLIEADTPAPADLYAAEDEAIRLGARFVSNSWGGDESPDQMRDADPHFDHPGVVIAAASGDGGFPGSYPATSQYVTAVGGTTLTRDPSTPRGWAESAWRLAGSTCSPWEPAPSFQNPAMTDCGKRAASDVSAVADPATGVAVYDRGWQVYGGTSVATPIITATYALAGSPLSGSYPNALPYQHPDALNDVTSGDNGCSFKFCVSGPGWDGPTGLGTPAGLAAFSPGPHGELVGAVRDRSGAPIAEATVSAGGQSVSTDPHGRYALTLPPGHYTLSATMFGYEERSAGLDLADGQTRTVNLALAARPRATVSGTVRDGSGHGWPVYASVEVAGQPSTRTFTDPVTGAYRLSLPRHDAYDLDVTPVYRGYAPATVHVAVGDNAVTSDVADPVEFASCDDALGYAYTSTPLHAEPFDAGTTPDGWTLSTNRVLQWAFDDPGGRGNLTGGTGGFAVVDSDHANQSLFQDASLVSPAWDLTGLTHPALTFHNDYFGMSNSQATVELSPDDGQTWTQLWIHRTDSVRGPNRQTIDLTRWAGQPSVQVRFRYQGYATWWWELDDVALTERACAPQPGGLVVGGVTDKNTGSGLTGASVTSDGAPVATTVATPDDAQLGEGRFWAFEPAGRLALTAGQPGGYRAVAETVTVVSDAAVAADFALPAGRLVVQPGQLATTVTLGGRHSEQLTVRNTGSAPATVSLHDVPGGVTAFGAQTGPATQQVPGTYRPGPASRTLTAATHTDAATPQAAPWQTAADFPIPITDNALAADDGTVYSAGGVSSTGQSTSAPLPRVYRYDPDAAAWTRLADLQVARDFPQAAFLDGRLYVAGGWDSTGGVTGKVEVYDPASNTWAFGPDLPTPVAAGSVAVLDNRMYVIGGCTADGVCGSTAVQVYDPDANRWEPAAAYPQPVAMQGCGTIAGRVYCAGGISDQLGPSRDGWAYDPTHDRWTQIAGMPYGSQYAAASAAAGGRLLMVGGVIDGGRLLTNQGWAYDPATDSWTSLPNANTVAWRAAGVCGFYKVGGSALQPALVNAEVLPGFGDCATAGNVSWLSAAPGGSRTLAPGTSATITVTLDAAATGVDQPGTYSAGLTLSEDTPYPFAAVPVTMTVQAPASWGELTGTVTGTTCTGAVVRLDAATITVSGRHQAFTLKTAADGTYQLWLDAANSPLSLVVGMNGWTPTGKSGIRLRKGQTATADVTLTPSPAC
ncbi:MAG TPA: carboxypeptidase regulatory-like domain-containing protein [Jatrophihabitantaceae bacterium]